MADIFNFTDTWNSGATTFNAIKVDVTDTASDAASLLLNLSVGGSVKASVRKDGHIVCATEAIGGATIGSNALAVTGTSTFSGNMAFGTAPFIGWGASFTVDTVISRNAAGIIQFGTTSANAAGSLLATNGTFSGGLSVTGNLYVDGSSGFTVFNTGFTGNRGFLVTNFSGTKVVNLASDWKFGWSTSTDATTTLVTTLSQNAAGVVQFGTSTNNALGSWLATSGGIGATPAVSASTYLNFSAGTTAASQFRLVASTAPTSPVNGDVWFDGTDLKIRIAGATKTVTVS